MKYEVHSSITWLLRGHLAAFINTFIMNSIICFTSLMYKLFYVVYCFNDFNGVTLY